MHLLAERLSGAVRALEILARHDEHAWPEVARAARDASLRIAHAVSLRDLWRTLDPFDRAALMTARAEGETAAEFRRGIRKRFDAVEFERRDALAQIERYRADSKSESGPGDAALIDAIPQLGLRFARLPDNLKWDIFDAFQLGVRYDGRDRGTRLQATITADAVPDLVRVGERAAAVMGVVDQPIVGRPRREPQNMAGRVRGADLRICATVAVSGRSRVIPLAPGGNA